MGSLEGRVAIVTGGAKGIGLAYCLGLAREGSAVVVADLRVGGHVVREIEAGGGRAISVTVDVSDRDSTENMARTVANEFGQIDILVNNAGFYLAATHAPFEDIDTSEWDTAFAVNVRGPWLCTRAVSPYMRGQKYGKVINISSMTVWDGTPNFLHYVTSKGAMIAFTRALARELGGDNIAVNCVTPDYIPHDPDYAAKQPQVDEIVRARRCFKRSQTPEDMVGTVLFLAGPWSEFITGQNIIVNGGSAFQ